MSNLMQRIERRGAVLALAGILVLMASCAPAAGRPTEEYLAPPQDVLSEIAAYVITLQPSSNMDFYSIETIGDRFVTVYSESTLGFSILVGRMVTRLTFTVQERSGVTVLAASGRGTNAEADLDRVILHLASVFERP